jgi:hypothetical protein
MDMIGNQEWIEGNNQAGENARLGLRNKISYF